MYNRIKGLMHASLIEAYIQRLILLLLTQPKIFKQKIQLLPAAQSKQGTTLFNMLPLIYLKFVFESESPEAAEVLKNQKVLEKKSQIEELADMIDADLQQLTAQNNTGGIGPANDLDELIEKVQCIKQLITADDQSIFEVKL